MGRLEDPSLWPSAGHSPPMFIKFSTFFALSVIVNSQLNGFIFAYDFFFSMKMQFLSYVCDFKNVASTDGERGWEEKKPNQIIFVTFS